MTLKMLSLILVLILASLTSGSKRSLVKVFGTTMSPVFNRPFEHFMTKCPDAHPYVFDNGSKCCRSAMKKSDTSLSSDCDGTSIKLSSNAACCFQDLFVDCEDQIRGCNYGKVCHPKPTIDAESSDPPHTVNLYDLENILSYKECEEPGDGSYFLTKNYKLNHKMIIDFGCEVAITKFYLRNVFQFGNRNTKNFKIETSFDKANWKLVISDSLTKPTSKCTMAIEEFAVTARTRYIRYTSVDYYGNKGGGLNYMSWDFVTF